jgi:hypothetical protein
MCPPEKERTEEQKKQAKIVEANISVSKYFLFFIFIFLLLFRLSKGAVKLKKNCKEAQNLMVSLLLLF